MHPQVQQLQQLQMQTINICGGFRCCVRLCAIKKKQKKPLPSKINSYFNQYVLLTAPCSILQNYSLLHLDGLDLPQVKKTLININGINTDIITMPLEAITAGAGVIP